MLITRYTAALLTFFLFTSPLYAAADNNSESLRHIDVSGKGIIYSTPDIATLTLTFSQRDKQAMRAKKTVDDQVLALLKITNRLHIEDKDIQAARLSISPEYDHKNNRQLMGYNVSRDVQLRLRELLIYPKLLEAGVEIGATHTGQLRFDFSHRKALENQALQAAFTAAEQQARLLADVAGEKLGNVQWIHSSAEQSPTPMLRMSMMSEKSARDSYQSGEMALSRHVKVRFSLQD